MTRNLWLLATVILTCVLVADNYCQNYALRGEMPFDSTWTDTDTAYVSFRLDSVRGSFMVPPVTPPDCTVAILDDFENGLTVVQPSSSEPQTRFLWNQYESDFTAGPDPGTEEVSNGELLINVTGGNIYMQFYPYPGYWEYMREFTNVWEIDKYNRMKFDVLVPDGYSRPTNGNHNFHVGTYVRESTASNTSQGSHYYHYQSIRSTGTWRTIIVDTHPHHRVSGSGGTEWGNLEYPHGESWNYFDSLTRFYFDGVGVSPSLPLDFSFDDFELYEERREDEDNIYALSVSVFGDSVDVTFSCHKDSSGVYEVRTHATDIHEFGWDNAEIVGTVTRPGSGGYNAMWLTFEYIFTGNRCFGVRQQGQTTGRQICLEN